MYVYMCMNMYVYLCLRVCVYVCVLLPVVFLFPWRMLTDTGAHEGLFILLFLLSVILHDASFA